MDSKRLQALLVDPSVLWEVLGNFEGAHAFGISRFPDEGEPQLTLHVECDDDSRFAKSITRHGETIRIIVKTDFKAPVPL